MATTPIFLPKKSHGQRSLTGYNPWGRKESNTTEHSTANSMGHNYTTEVPDAMSRHKQKSSEHKSLVCLLLCPVDT